ncbi:acetate--CoA ligase family protein [Candidimonas humi]|uniref:Acetate--CoA ligase family protein n=1 Tax=Candidimonas humi TaxID=683355 RepID=A0ABV8P421_9BURK|nr:acetate--CoA ligase family protein [Candidimonas humi]MBV6306796.1 acetate--CoA ligase family protein [Candidimonas humi]
MLSPSVSAALLSPRSVALIGASTDLSKNSARPLRFMRKHGFQGRVYLVNARGGSAGGETVYQSVLDIPEPVDHAFVMTAARHVPQVLAECARKGVPVASIYSDGFAEIGQAGAQAQRELIEQARRDGLRVLGPNSIGTANAHTGGVVSVNAVFEMDVLPRGDISLVSQSGSMMGSLLSRAAARGFGFAKSVSVGNESDISVGEVVDSLVDDRDTRVILLFLETLRDAQTLGAALDRARAAGKPVIAYKLGRSEQGDALSQSHTGAMAGNDAAIGAFFAAHGVMRVSVLEALLELAPLARAYAGARPARGAANQRRIAVITTTGGGAATVVDNLGLRGFTAVAPPAEFVAHMAGRGLTIRSTPVIDLTLAASSAQYLDLLEQLLQADWCDAVLSVVGSSAQFHPQLAVRPIIECAKPSDRPLAAFLAPEAGESLSILLGHGIAAFRTPESCADALAAFFEPPGELVSCAGQSTPSLPDDLPRHGPLNEAEAGRLFGALGMPMADSQWLRSADEAHAQSYPVVLKVVSRDILHKTDAGGVRTGLADREALSAAMARMSEDVARACPEARLEGFLVQPMERGLIELILGYRHDPLVGPTVLLGAGGVAAELIPDYSLRLAPVSREQAMEMIEEVRHIRLVRGYRGLPQADLGPLADAVAAFSRLACLEGQPVAEAEINPLFVQKDAVVAVDAVAVWREGGGPDAGAAHRT